MEDPDQTASSEAVWSGPALFVKIFLVGNLCLEILEHLPYTKKYIQKKKNEQKTISSRKYTPFLG